MGTAGMRLVHGLDPAEIADDLGRLYCYEQVSVAEAAWESEGGATASQS